MSKNKKSIRSLDREALHTRKFSSPTIQDMIRQAKEAQALDSQYGLNLGGQEWVDELERALQATPQQTDTTRAQGGRRWQDLSAEDLIKQTQEMISRDRTRNANLPQAIYQGQEISPMSALTQKSRQLQTGWNQKGAPYQKKINKVLARDRQGLSPQNIGGLSQMMEQGQEKFSKNNALKALQDQFGPLANAMEPEFLKNAQETTNRESGLSKERLGVLGQKLGNAQGESNQTLINLLEMLKGGKQQKRSAYTNMANEFGGQQHAHNNMQIEANKQKFYNEANAPHKNLAMLERALATQGLNPETANPTELLQALQAYGIDPNKLMTEQQSPKRHQGYEGQRVANMAPETKASHVLLEQIDPKYTRAATYGQQKGLVNELMDENNTLGNQAAQNVPTAVQKQVDDLERRANEMIQERVAGIANKYANAGQHNSPGHQQEARRIAEKISESLAQERAKLIEHALSEQAQIAQGNTYNKIRNAAGLGGAGQNEFMDVLSNLRGMNKIGGNKFNNEQDELERIYHNHQAQNLHEWPHMRDAARMGVLNQLLPGQESTLSGRLNRNNTGHSEFEKEMSGLNQQYDTLQQAFAAFPTQNAHHQLNANAQQQMQPLQNKMNEQQQWEQERPELLRQYHLIKAMPQEQLGGKQKGLLNVVKARYGWQ